MGSHFAYLMIAVGCLTLVFSLGGLSVLDAKSTAEGLQAIDFFFAMIFRGFVLIAVARSYNALRQLLPKQND